MGKTDTPPNNLRGFLRYEARTGKFFWLVSRGRVAAGDEAGTLDKYGYVQIKIDGAFYKAHRLAWYFKTGEWLKSDQGLDHKIPDPADNRWGNLRKATQKQNRTNRRYNTPTNNTSGQMGVTRRLNGKWQAFIHVGDRFVYLGSYVNFEDAVAARKHAEIKHDWR
jgi:hypothetical protein